MTIRVVSYDEQTLLRAGVKAVLEREADIEIVEEISEPSELVQRADLLKPDVVLLGLPIGDLDPAAVVRRLAARSATVGIIALVGNDQNDGLVTALRTGLRGVVRKDDPPGDLVRAIRAVVRGAASLTPSVAAQLLDWAVATRPIALQSSRAMARLTERERQVLMLVAEGLADAEIAHELSVATATVRSHMHHVLAKLKVRGRIQAVAIAYQHGMTSYRAGHNSDK